MALQRNLALSAMVLVVALGSSADLFGASNAYPGNWVTEGDFTFNNGYCTQRWRCETINVPTPQGCTISRTPIQSTSGTCPATDPWGCGVCIGMSQPTIACQAIVNCPDQLPTASPDRIQP